MQLEKPLEVTSPGERVAVQVDLDEAGRPYYRVWFQEELVLDTSFLGLDLTHEPDLHTGFSIVEAAESAFDETWEQPWGEERFIQNKYKELRITLAEAGEKGRIMGLCFRVYDDGVGFRYEFPEQPHLQNLEITHELTEFHMAADMMRGGFLPLRIIGTNTYTEILP